MSEACEIGALVRWTAEVCGNDWEMVGFDTIDQMEECFGVVVGQELRHGGTGEILLVRVFWTDGSTGATWTDVEKVRGLEALGLVLEAFAS